MFAGAAFTDSADVSQTEAVDMLTALGVIDGYEDGSFRPDATVTRAEMAKMIYVIRNGGSDVVTQYEGYKTPFTDVENVGHWAKGYIAYCYANGIISGKTATSFDPDATVTGTEAAKMALVLIGYDPAKAGLEGSAWATNTINLATKKDLFKSYGIAISGGCDRQYAAQLLYNTLWAGTVRWSNDANGYEDVVDYDKDNNGVVVGLAYVTVAKKYMGLEETIVTYKGDSKVNTGLAAGQSVVGVDTIITFVPENGNEWLGESVKVLFKNSKDGSTRYLDKYDTIYGMALSGETSTVKATLGDIGDDENNKIDVNGTKYELNDAYFSINDDAIVKEISNDAEKFTDDYVINKDTVNNKIFEIKADDEGKGTGFKQNSADEVKFVLDETNKIIGIYVTHVNFYKVTGLTSGKISLAGLGTLDIDDNTVVADDVAVNDIVAMTTLYDGDPSDDDAFNTIEKATVASGVKVTNMKSATEVMIDGAYSNYAKINDCVTTADTNYKSEVELDGTYDFIMYGDYWVAAKKVSASSKDIALVTGADTNGLEDRVKVMTSDGTETVYTYDDNDGDGADITYIYNDKKLTDNKLFSFTLVGDSKIQLTNGTMTYEDAEETKVKDQNGGKEVAGLTFVLGAANKNAAKVFYNDETKSITTDAGSYVAAEDAVAYVKTVVDGKTKTYAYNIDDMKTIDWADIGKVDDLGNFTAANNGANVEYVLNDDKEVVALYVETASKPGATTSTDEYGYIIDNPATSSVDGSKCVELSVWNGTETVTLKIEVSSADASWVKGAFIKYNVGSDGLTDKGDVKVLETTGAVKTYDTGRKLLTLYVGTDATKTTTYTLADDVAIIGVNTKDKALVEGMTAVPQAFVEKNVATANVLYARDDDGKVVAIFVDTNNKITLP